VTVGDRRFTTLNPSLKVSVLLLGCEGDNLAAALLSVVLFVFFRKAQASGIKWL
jgi:hypothetical protein